MDPVIDEYERHEGSITCVKCSPIRNLFVTAGTDKEIRMYDFEEVTISFLQFIYMCTLNVIKIKIKIFTLSSTRTYIRFPVKIQSWV